MDTMEAVPEVKLETLADGDRLLLCTDGLSDLVEEEVIATHLGRGSSPQETCQALVQLALDRGGKDNVTVAIADYQVSRDD
jgi:protein phosphatase